MMSGEAYVHFRREAPVAFLGRVLEDSQGRARLAVEVCYRGDLRTGQEVELQYPVDTPGRPLLLDGMVYYQPLQPGAHIKVYGELSGPCVQLVPSGVMIPRGEELAPFGVGFEAVLEQDWGGQADLRVVRWHRGKLASERLRVAYPPDTTELRKNESLTVFGVCAGPEALGLVPVPGGLQVLPPPGTWLRRLLAPHIVTCEVEEDGGGRLRTTVLAAHRGRLKGQLAVAYSEQEYWPFRRGTRLKVWGQARAGVLQAVRGGLEGPLEPAAQEARSSAPLVATGVVAATQENGVTVEVRRLERGGPLSPGAMVSVRYRARVLRDDAGDRYWPFEQGQALRMWGRLLAPEEQVVAAVLD